MGWGCRLHTQADSLILVIHKKNASTHHFFVAVRRLHLCDLRRGVILTPEYKQVSYMKYLLYSTTNSHAFYFRYLCSRRQSLVQSISHIYGSGFPTGSKILCKKTVFGSDSRGSHRPAALQGKTTGGTQTVFLVSKCANPSFFPFLCHTQTGSLRKKDSWGDRKQKGVRQNLGSLNFIFTHRPEDLNKTKKKKRANPSFFRPFVRSFARTLQNSRQQLPLGIFIRLRFVRPCSSKARRPPLDPYQSIRVLPLQILSTLFPSGFSPQTVHPILNEKTPYCVPVLRNYSFNPQPNQPNPNKPTHDPTSHHIPDTLLCTKLCFFL